MTKSLQQLAAEYGVHVNTFRRWIRNAADELGFIHPFGGRLFTPKQVERIYDTFGSPDDYRPTI